MPPLKNSLLSSLNLDKQTEDLSNNNHSKAEDKQEKPKLIGINGNWYDITNFIPHHPGGEIIKSFIGVDASTVYHSFHRKDHLKHRKPVGTYQVQRESDAHELFVQLHQKFEEEGYFNPDQRWYKKKFALTGVMLLLSIISVARFEDTYIHCIGAFFLAAFWQQCGFLMHDFMHNHFSHNRHVDQKLGQFFGTVCLGLSASWWRDEHFIHHALTNSVDHASNFCDPQGCEAVWAQNEKLFPRFKTTFEKLAIKVQHITFLPLCIFTGRYAIVLDSFLQERRPSEWVAAAVHWCCIISLLNLLPTWEEVAIFYFIAGSAEGVLHIQLLLSHYCKPFCEKQEMVESESWYVCQATCTMDIDNPWWLDWFHGGLNFHVAHHLFPTMPRHNYRQATVHIKAVCAKAGIKYDSCCWTDAIYYTLVQLKKMSKHFSMDPR